MGWWLGRVPDSTCGVHREAPHTNAFTPGAGRPKAEGPEESESPGFPPPEPPRTPEPG